MPRQTIQPALNLVVKEAMADAEAAFLKTFLNSADPEQTLGDILAEILGEDLVDYSKLDHAAAQAVKGLLSIRASQIKLDKKKAKPAPAKKKRSRRAPANGPGTAAESEGAAE